MFETNKTNAEYIGLVSKVMYLFGQAVAPGRERK